MRLTQQRAEVPVGYCGRLWSGASRFMRPSIGVITTMHIGIMGMMAQMQIADLGAKTKPGLSGRVRA